MAAPPVPWSFISRTPDGDGYRVHWYRYLKTNPEPAVKQDLMDGLLPTYFRGWDVEMPLRRCRRSFVWVPKAVHMPKMEENVEEKNSNPSSVTEEEAEKRNDEIQAKFMAMKVKLDNVEAEKNQKLQEAEKRNDEIQAKFMAMKVKLDNVEAEKNQKLQEAEKRNDEIQAKFMAMKVKLDNVEAEKNQKLQESPTATTVASLGDLVASHREEVTSQQNFLEDLEVRTSQGFAKVELALKLRGGCEIEPLPDSESEYEPEDSACDSSDIGNDEGTASGYGQRSSRNSWNDCNHGEGLEEPKVLRETPSTRHPSMPSSPEALLLRAKEIAQRELEALRDVTDFCGAKKKMLRKWHPDKQPTPETVELATEVTKIILATEVSECCDEAALKRTDLFSVYQRLLKTADVASFDKEMERIRKDPMRRG